MNKKISQILKNTKKIILAIFFLFCCNNNTNAQFTEKYLKLNKIVCLDSVKSINTSSSTNVLKFTITVPSGVYWKLSNVTLASLDGASLFYNYYVNQSIFPNGFPTSLWLKPNSVIKIYQTAPPNTITSPGNLTLYLTAEEYFLE